MKKRKENKVVYILLSKLICMELIMADVETFRHIWMNTVFVKLRQKDVDAKWTRKGGVLYYGYKDHVKADADSKLITDYVVTSESVHDSQMLPDMINEQDKVLYADSAYWVKTVADALPAGIKNRIQERGTRHITITEEQR